MSCGPQKAAAKPVPGSSEAVLGRQEVFSALLGARCDDARLEAHATN